MRINFYYSILTLYYPSFLPLVAPASVVDEGGAVDGVVAHGGLLICKQGGEKLFNGVVKPKMNK